MSPAHQLKRNLQTENFRLIVNNPLLSLNFADTTMGNWTVMGGFQVKDPVLRSNTKDTETSPQSGPQPNQPPLRENHSVSLGRKFNGA